MLFGDRINNKNQKEGHLGQITTCLVGFKIIKDEEENESIDNNLDN